MAKYSEDDPRRRRWPKYRLEDLRVERVGKRWKHYFDAKGRQVCGAALAGARKGLRCPQTGRSLAPSGRCRTHGGAPGVGRVPTHGRVAYRDFIGAQAERFQELLDRPDFLRTDPQAALFDIEIERLLEEAQEGKGPEWRAALLGACLRLAQVASTKPESVEGLAEWAGSVGAAASAVAELLGKGVKADEDTARALRYAQQRAEIAIAERKTRVLEEVNLPEKMVLASYGRIATIIFRSLPEREARRIIDEIALGLVSARGADLLRAGQEPPGSAG